MTKALSFDELLERKHISRMRREDRALERIERQERREERDRAAALRDPRVGHLMRGGEVVYYVWPAGGEYRESADAGDLAVYL